MKKIESVHIVFFSGTGGTARIANALENEFTKKHITVVKTELNGSVNKPQKADVLILLYPVYACNAPKPVEEWIAKAPMGNGMPAAVLSVSGGGEVTPNTACRVETIKRLRRKGYKVRYENAFVMPSNFLIGYSDILSAMILQKSEDKSKLVVDDILKGKQRFTQPKRIDRIIATLAVVEKSGCKLFGKRLKANNSCSSCGWCSMQCPRKNIVIKNGRPSFGDRCVICMRCIYGCPKHAIEAGFGKCIVLKNGYDLMKLEERTKRMVRFPLVSDITRGYALGGVKKYLEEDTLQRRIIEKFEK